MASLSKKTLERLIFEETDIDKRLIITPLIDRKEQIGEGTVDLRLGTKFILFRKPKIALVDPADANVSSKIRECQERIYCKFGDQIILQTGEFVLGSSFEYVRVPSNIFCLVGGRSSWGRLGLIIETSPVIHPCFTGVITFELLNLGNAPIPLYPGCRIAQMSAFQTDEAESSDCLKRFRGKYKFNPEPSFSRIPNDVEFQKVFGKNA